MKGQLLLQFVVPAPSLKGFSPLGEMYSQASALVDAIKAVNASVVVSTLKEVLLKAAQQAVTDAITTCGSRDQLIVSFLGHGAQFAPNGVTPQEHWIFQDGAMSDLWLFDSVNKGIAKGLDIVIVSDCCRGGGMFGDLSRLFMLKAVSATDDRSTRSEGAPGISSSDATGTVLVVAPVSKDFNTTPGFTGDLAMSGNGYITYCEVFAKLAAGKWQGVRHQVHPPSRNVLVMDARRFDYFQ